MRLHLALYRWWSCFWCLQRWGPADHPEEQDHAGALSGEFEGVIDSYVDENKKDGRELDVEQFKGLSSYKTEAVSEIYRFLNGQVYRGDYYLFDRDRNLVFSTNSQSQCHTVHRKLSALEHNGPE